MFKERNLDRFQKPGEMFSSQSVGQFFFFTFDLDQSNKIFCSVFVESTRGKGRKEREVEAAAEAAERVSESFFFKSLLLLLPPLVPTSPPLPPLLLPSLRPSSASPSPEP